MKALSVKQPWAYLITESMKSIEVRSWKTDYRGDIIICSSKGVADFVKVGDKNDQGQYFIYDKDNPKNGDYMDLSSALCVVELHDITPFEKKHEKAAGCVSAPGLYAWHLKNIRPIEPVPVKGKLKLFELDL